MIVAQGVSLVMLAAVSAMLLRPALAQGDVYAYTNEQGVLHLTDAPHDARYQWVLSEPKRAPVAPLASTPLAPEPTAHSALPLTPATLQPLIHAAAIQHRVDPALVQAVMQVESNFNPRAVSPVGAQGLMQLMPATAQRYGVTNVFDPTQNIHAGVRYLADLLALFKNDLRLVLAAYNAGENAVMQYGNQIPPYRETRDYVPKVLTLYRRFQAGNTRL